MSVTITELRRYGERLVVDGYFDAGTHFHGTLEEPLLGEARALLERLELLAAERLRQRETMVASQMWRGPQFSAAEIADFWKNEISPGGSL